MTIGHCLLRKKHADRSKGSIPSRSANYVLEPMFNISTKVDFFTQRFSETFFSLIQIAKKFREGFELAAGEVNFGILPLKYDDKILKYRSF